LVADREWCEHVCFGGAYGYGVYDYANTEQIMIHTRSCVYGSCTVPAG
jgi:hypothetical protein